MGSKGQRKVKKREFGKVSIMTVALMSLIDGFKWPSNSVLEKKTSWEYSLDMLTLKLCSPVGDSCPPESQASPPVWQPVTGLRKGIIEEMLRHTQTLMKA